MDHFCNISLDSSGNLLLWTQVLEGDFVQTVPSHWLKFQVASKTEHYFLGALYIVLAVVGLLANGTIVFLYFRCRSLRVPSNILVLNLAISDFFMLSKTPIFIHNSFHCGPVLGQAGCQLYAFLGGLTGTSAIMTIASMAAERFITISRPLSKRLTNKRALVVVAFIWIYSATFASMPLFGVFTKYVPEGYLTSCSFDYLSPKLESRIFIFCFFVAAFCVPMTVIVVSYIGIIVAVRRSELNLNIPNSSKSDDNHNQNNQKKVKSARQKLEIKLAKISACLISLWLISWTPYAVMALIGIFSDQELLTPLASMIPALFAKAAAVIDPFVYGHSHPRFRFEIRRLLCPSLIQRRRTTLMATRGLTVDDAQRG